MKPYRELAGQTLIYGLGTILPRILNFLLTPLYTYTLIESDFGTITYLYSYVAFLMVLLTFGMETTYFRFSAIHKNSNKVYSSAYILLTTVSLLFLVLYFIFKDTLFQLIKFNGNAFIINILALIVFFDVITAIPLARLRQENKARFFAIIRTINVLINISLNVFFFVFCKDSSNPVLNGLYNENIGVGYAFLSNLAASVFTFFVLLPALKFIKFSIDKQLFREMLKYALPLVIVGFAGMVNEVADKIFLNYLIPEQLHPMMQIGIYGANYKLAVLMTIFIQMFKYAAEPFFFKQSVQSDAKEIYSRVMTYFVIFCLLIFLVVTLYIDGFKLLIARDYRVGLSIVPIVLLANMFLGIYYNLSIWYKVNNLTIYGAIIAVFGLLVTVALNFLLIPIMGYMGSAIATLVCYFSIVVVSYFYGNRVYKVDYQVKRIVGYIASALILFLLFKYINLQNLVFKFGLATLFMMLFMIIVAYVERINVSTLKSFILKK